MEIPTFYEIFFIMILIIPGFFSLNIIRKLGQLKRQLSDTELLCWSLACSLCVYLLSTFMLYIFNFIKYDDINNIEIIILNLIKPIPLLVSSVSLMILSFIIGYILRIYRISRNFVPHDTWSSVIQKERDSDWVIIHTNDGDEYKGIIKYYGIDDEPRDLSIINPIKIIRNKNMDEDENMSYYFGEEIYFNESNIKRIIFLVEDQKNGSDEEVENNGNKDDIEIDKIQMSQNSVLTWLATGLGSAIGIFELGGSNLKYQWLIFELLLFFCVFSIERIISHMNDIIEIRGRHPELTTNSMEKLTSIYMDHFFTFMNSHSIFEKIFYILVFLISHIFWYSIPFI